MELWSAFQLALGCVLIYQGMTYDSLPNWWRAGLFALAAVNIMFAFV